MLVSKNGFEVNVAISVSNAEGFLEDVLDLIFIFFLFLICECDYSLELLPKNTTDLIVFEIRSDFGDEILEYSKEKL
jgi:hypothetical protein